MMEITNETCKYLKFGEPIMPLNFKSGIPRCGCKWYDGPVLCEFYENQKKCIEYEPRGSNINI